MFRTHPLQPLVVSFGGGVDSTAMIIGLYRKGIRIDMILFADVGSEWPETYEFVYNIFPRYLRRQGLPQVTVVRYRPQKFKYGPYSTIEGNCLRNSTLPSLAFGRKACSRKWKIAPMDKHVEAHPEMQEWMAGGGKVLRAIGYDAGPKDSCRGGNITPSPHYEYIYPLRTWGWDRDRCIEEIRKEGLEPPRKSSCFFCPSMQPQEVIQLATDHPHLAKRAVLMEDRAQPNLQKIEGLWRNGVKGIRDPSKKRPGRWRTFLEANVPELDLSDDSGNINEDDVKGHHLDED